MRLRNFSRVSLPSKARASPTTNAFIPSNAHALLITSTSCMPMIEKKVTFIYDETQNYENLEDEKKYKKEILWNFLEDQSAS